MAEQKTTSWHLEKTISIGHIITTLSVAGGLIIWGMRMDSRVSVLEAETVHSQQADTRMDQQWRESLQRVEGTLIRIESKLDGKADKKGG